MNTTTRGILLIAVGVLVLTFVSPIGYTPAALMLLAGIAYGFYTVLRWLNARFEVGMPERGIVAFAAGTFLLSAVAWLRFITCVDASPC